MSNLRLKKLNYSCDLNCVSDSAHILLYLFVYICCYKRVMLQLHIKRDFYNKIL